MTSLKQMLKQKNVIVGLTTQHITHPWLAKLWKRSGTDFVYLEYEHGFWNEGDLAAFILCCRAEGLPVVAKVPECSRTHVAKLLESGVIGIQLPWTESRRQIDQLVSYVKFPPLGIRAASPGMGNCDYDFDIEFKRFIEEANQETVILAHVETRPGISNIDEILASPGVDILFLGLTDLTVSYGDPGNYTNPELASAIERVLASARKAGKAVGMWVPNYEVAKPWIQRGVSFFETASEVDMIDSSARRLVSQFR
jgi:2-keto-3-deoxy-L-rhamnonate aldolase RhmA